MYFKRNELLGLQPPAALPSSTLTFAAPMPSGAPPPPGGGVVGVAAPAPAGQQQQGNIFQRFTERVAALGYTLPDVFQKHDIDKSGQLTQNQVWTNPPGVGPLRHCCDNFISCSSLTVTLTHHRRSSPW